MKNYMEVINKFFAKCEKDTIEMMEQNNKEYRAAAADTKVVVEYESELFGKIEKSSYETEIVNHKPFRQLEKRSRCVYTKQQSIFYHQLKDSINEEDLTDEQKDWFNRLNLVAELKEAICNRYPQKMVEFALAYRWEKIQSEAAKYIHKFFEEKKQSLLDRVAKKGGAIIDAIEIHEHWETGELNGVFSCENGRVEINTIFAGGYNIQCLHIRNLVHLLK